MDWTKLVTELNHVAIQGTSVFGLANKASLMVPISLVQESTNVLSTALIDSGAQGNFIDTTLAQQFKLAPFEQEIICRNVDGTDNANGTIRHYTWIKVVMDDQPFYCKFAVTNLGEE